MGAHIFYRWAGGWGRPAAFAKRYAGPRSRTRGRCRLAALSVPHAACRAQCAPPTTAGARRKVAGVEVKTADGGRVRVHFNPQARAAVEAVKVAPYVERVAASDNLRCALDGAAADGTTPKPLGARRAGQRSGDRPATRRQTQLARSERRGSEFAR